jgi:hypothetical protein
VTIDETMTGISVEDVAGIEQPVMTGTGEPKSSMLAAFAAGIPHTRRLSGAEPHGTTPILESTHR